MKPNSHHLAIVPENKVFTYLCILVHGKAKGLDGIVKDLSSVIAGPLSHIINMFIIQDSASDDLMIARGVVPYFKKDDYTKVGNYRPVSIINIISKIGLRTS